MALPLICALVYLLLSVRVMADVRLRAGGARQDVRITLRAWGIRLTLDMPLRLRMEKGHASERVRRAKGTWPFVKAALREIRWGQTDVHVRIGTKDAALTAMLAGGLGALGAAFQAAAGQRFPCHVTAAPVFSAAGAALSARCIFSLVPGDIMFAVAKAAVKKTQREGFSWLSIPLKA